MNLSPIKLLPRLSKQLFWMLLICLFYVTQFRVATSYSQSFKFVDEDEYIVIAWLLNKGDALYSGVHSNHQPLTYLFSKSVQKVVKPANLFMLIKQHRMAVFGWSFLWSIFLVYRFGLPMVFPLTIFESIKYFTLGNEFVAESFAAYPLVYQFMAFIEQLHTKQTRREDFFLGIASALSVWLLIPLVVPVGFLFIFRYLLKWSKHIFTYTSGIGLVALYIFTQVSILDYWRETIYYNSKYGIPLIAHFTSVLDVLKLLLLPQLNWWGKTDFLAQIFGFMGLVWVIGGLFLLITAKWKLLRQWFLIWFLWGITNARVNTPHVYFYEAFHLTPWLLVGLSSTLYFFLMVCKQIQHRLLKFATFGLVLVCGTWFAVQPNMPFRHLPEPFTENYVQFTPIVQSAQVISIFKAPNDRLIVLPIEALEYWLTNLQPADRQVTYYEWQFQHPVLRQQFLNTLTSNSPRFIQYSEDGSSYGPLVQKILTERYTKILDYPAVYMRKDTLKFITADQRQQYKALAQNLNGLNHDLYENK